MRKLSALATFAVAFLGSPSANAQALSSGGAFSPLNLVVLLAALAILPFLLIMVTSFVKVAVVLSILRQAIGAQRVPPNQVITGLAIVLTLYIMAPVGHDIYTNIRPQLDTLQNSEAELSLDDLEAMTTDGIDPLREFLVRHSDAKERRLLYELAIELHTAEQAADSSSDNLNAPARPAPYITDDSLMVLVPSFVVTELKEAFTIGFILFVPFIIIDMVVANVLLSLGMHMLSPTTISLPFKLLLFVLVDGWFLVVKGLVLGYAPG